ncbi:hypothetical protein JAAARDRAFT_192379 [Jaapia argillacea MUCL 33604]|uniref:PPM-type phosphatase domain-containing protein n=1 Tax=Jaapia argillacea MUCL 33604 TaxID=933084 RepID=A0A067PYQ9_9AGAM|nr:hypothetical protein JAAARDRAFT_192379 [Jaapia argillacea MUCL 33604]
MIRNFRYVFRNSRPAKLASAGAVTFALGGSFWAYRAQHSDCDAQSSPKSDNTTTQQPRKFQINLESVPPIDINEILQRHEQSHRPLPASGISRYDVAMTESNNPSEDDHAEAVLPVPNGFWGLFAVLDGHSGWETSAWLRENLISAVSGSLADLYSKYRSNDSTPHSTDHDPPPGEVDDNIKQTFQRLDDDIIREPLEKVFSTPSRHAAVNLLAAARAGSCALLAFYESPTRLLRIALTGDSRAVLGRRKPTADGGHTYEVHVLSVEQDGHNPSEAARLKEEHPDEEDVVKNGRVVGMGVARAFGDAQFKWALDLQKKLLWKYLGNYIYPNIKTPPYLTAVPEVTTIKVEPGDFLILGTDGLWECLSSEQAVGLTGLWVDSKQPGFKPTETGRWLPSELPVENSGEVKVRYRQWCAAESMAFINVDSNAATHLVRNALGGADADLTAALLSLRSPRSRTWMDDITAVVVFFDDT